MVKRWFKDRSQCAVLDEMSKQGQGGAEEETGSPEERSRLRRGDSAVKGMKVHTRRSTSPKRRGTGVNVFGRFLPDQLRILESHFQQNEKPSDAEVQSILFEIGNEGKGKLSVNMVKRWFKEKRAVGGVLSPATSPLSTSPLSTSPLSTSPTTGGCPISCRFGMLPEQLAILEHYYLSVSEAPDEEEQSHLAEQLTLQRPEDGEVSVARVRNWFEWR